MKKPIKITEPTMSAVQVVEERWCGQLPPSVSEGVSALAAAAKSEVGYAALAEQIFRDQETWRQHQVELEFARALDEAKISVIPDDEAQRFIGTMTPLSPSLVDKFCRHINDGLAPEDKDYRNGAARLFDIWGIVSLIGAAVSLIGWVRGGGNDGEWWGGWS